MSAIRAPLVPVAISIGPAGGFFAIEETVRLPLKRLAAAIVTLVAVEFTCIHRRHRMTAAAPPISRPTARTVLLIGITLEKAYLREALFRVVLPFTFKSSY